LVNRHPRYNRHPVLSLRQLVHHGLQLLVCVEGLFQIVGKLFPKPPAAVFESSGELDIIYTGPLVRAQRADIAQGVTRWVATLAELGEVTPDVLDVPNWDAIAKELASLEGVPAKLMNSDIVIKKQRRQRQEAQAAQQQALQAQEEGAGMEAVGKGKQALAEVVPIGQGQAAGTEAA
ncbi:MAG: portal protein, partial [Anaerolineales bacterium]